MKHYNLDAILAVGYRFRAHRGTQFRRWATERLKGYLVKGFVLDHQRLKEGRTIGADYFDELDAFLKFYRHDILKNPGQVSAGAAKQLAEA